MAAIVNNTVVGVVMFCLSIVPTWANDKGSAAPRLHTIPMKIIMSKSSEYVEKYAEAAMEQMRKYGIPASVTLAQGILESANGQSELSRKGNNHFGIKATSSWVNQGGAYLVYADDKPNEKFCKYASVADSYEHHSLFLKANGRYSNLFRLPADDYVGWTKGLQDAGYATSSKYAASLQSVIKSQGLDKYDKMVIQELVYKKVNGESVAKTESQTNDQTQKVEQSADQSQSTDTKQEQKQDNDYFNTIQANAGNDNSWGRFLGASGNGVSSLDPIVELASSMFAGLMAIAVQIDSMEEGASIQVNQQTNALASTDANTMAAKNFDAALDAMNNNTIKRSRS